MGDVDSAIAPYNHVISSSTQVFPLIVDPAGVMRCVASPSKWNFGIGSRAKGLVEISLMSFYSPTTIANTKYWEAETA